MQLHQLQRKNPNKTKKRVGRGGLRGKTSGHGHKGQKARAGGTPRPQSRDIIKKIPKRRGYGKNRAKTVHGGRMPTAVVNLAALEKHFQNGDTVSPQILVEKKLVRKHGKRTPVIKILSQGTLSKKLTFSGVVFSETARKSVEKTGAAIT